MGPKKTSLSLKLTFFFHTLNLKVTLRDKEVQINCIKKTEKEKKGSWMTKNGN